MRAKHSQRGFSLVEVMVSIVIALILLAGIIQLFISNKQAYRIQEGFSLLSENARYSISQLQYHLRIADHWGGVQPDVVDTSIAPAITNDCSAGYSTDNIGLEGYEGGAGVPADLTACIPAADYVANSDIIVLRYGGTPMSPIYTTCPTANDECLENGEVYLRVSTGRQAQIFQGNNTGGLNSVLDDPDPDSLEPYNIHNYPYKFVAYFVRPCSSQAAGTAGVCDAADDDTPTLVRLALDGTSLVQEDVAEGVEQLQIDYGVDTNGNLNADQYMSVAEIEATNNWPSVVTVRFNMLVRATNRDITRSTDDDDNEYYMFGKPYNIDNGPYQVPDADRTFPRKMFTAIVQIRNQSRS
ncbi:MAG: PilW family protein [Gammaproteobacteria bacterium]|nr:PilW family protein [Gammaproteobacteria bacterium]